MPLVVCFKQWRGLKDHTTLKFLVQGTKHDAWNRFIRILVNDASFNNLTQPLSIGKKIAAPFYQLSNEQLLSAKMTMHQSLHVRGGLTNDLAEDLFQDLWNLGFDVLCCYYTMYIESQEICLPEKQILLISHKQ